MTSKLC